MKHYILILSLLCAAIAAIPSCSKAESSVEIDFTGDILMHYAVKGCSLVHAGTDEKKQTVKGFEYLFEKIAPELKSADFAITNMEFPVSPPFIQNEFIFNCPPEVVPALKSSGFYAVNLANNHLLDQGRKGVMDTLGYVEAAGLKYFGAARTEKEASEGIILEKNGIRIGIISYTGILNYAFPPANSKFYLNNLSLTDKVAAEIKALKKRCDFLVVQPHDGVEYTQEPTASQRVAYKKLLEAGADIVIGHHPHTIQSAESVKTSDGRTCAIFYSLGNFICNQTYCYPVKGRKDSLDIRASFIPRLKVMKNFTTVTSSVTIVPIYTVHEMRYTSRRQYKDIQTVSIPAELERLRAELTSASESKKAAITRQINFYEQQRDMVQYILFHNGPVAGVSVR
jgi:poly-gamma-glutamate capsule biosynthesis protein CapA/YwtB (metallophosphatase superfamily)